MASRGAPSSPPPEAGRDLLSPEQRLDWLRLIRTENVGPRTFRVLINQYGGAAAALEALPTLARRGGRLVPPQVPSRADAEAEMAGLARMGGRLVALGEADYPAALRALDDAPPLIAVRGRAELLRRPKVAMVGARNASAAGRSFAARLARDLGADGWVVVSGLARGIDAAAHEASLETGTVGVFAGGLTRPYPPENLKLIETIAERGVLVSEMPLGWEPRARDFPRRNRLVSGLSLGVVVVEAAERSGSLITARLAGEQGREVFAVPGSPLDPRAGGTNRLLKQGATLVTEAGDVTSVLAPMIGREPDGSGALAAPDALSPPPAPGDDVRGRVLELLSPVPTPVDDLIRLSGASAAEVQIILLELELAGRLDRPGTGRVALR
ncbi:DNA-processing protein DprA [Xanthobacter tagetidis]|uniref:DNA-protecting protein DprA n=1 Tax=Xanthobacter tagetidis TaxID=60216 RepID=A0A3L7AD25_9HYPH|nr:DNA-processing protein DprA [Xanthobacter tagetidis]MBB6305852.1 DNA processing protein [Xanthobacter tagetidis]RLP78376.1 DNA-protecting protein DprA [Xanthobacter tagetidis]